MLEADVLGSASARRVLVVEDEHHVCQVLSDALEEEGLEPLCVHTDRDALAILREEPRVACLVTDVNLGVGTTGYDVARVARLLDPGLPVIYVSGESTEATFQANGVPGSLFLPKPFAPAELIERVRRLLGDD